MAGSTPIYGFPYPEPSDLVANYPALGQDLAEEVETVISGLGSGFDLISPTSIANSGGTATNTSGTITLTGVTSVSLNSCFTSTYENYKIIFTGSGSATSAAAEMRLRTGGTDATATNYVYQMIYSSDGATGRLFTSNGAGSMYVGWILGGGTPLSAFSIDVFRPQKAAVTGFSGTGTARDNSQYITALAPAGGHMLATSYDGFTLYPQSGTLTGVIRVYGYKGA